MNMTNQPIPMYVFQILVWGPDVRDADFDVVWAYASEPNQIAANLRVAEVLARDEINQKRADEGLQLTYITIIDFTFVQTPKGLGSWTYTDQDTGLTVAIHETELKQ